MRLFDVRRKELPALAWAAAWFFCVLSAYYAIRPVRETFAAEIPSSQRATLFTATLFVMVLATPLYGLVVAKIPRRWLVLAVYGFFVSNLLGFWLLLSSGDAPAWLPEVFFVWISVFNLFVVTLFWGTVVDLFSGEQGKRLFGLVFGAGTLGQLASSYGVQASTEQLGMASLLAIAGGLLIGAIFCSVRLRQQMPRRIAVTQNQEAAPKNTLAMACQGVTAVARSPYLLGIALVIFSLSICATVVYFLMTDMVAAQLESPADRLKWFARVNLVQACVTLLMQTAVVGWLLRKIGVGWTLALVPAIFLAGFTAFSITQTLLVIGIFQVALRSASFSLGNPALEVLYTAVAPEQKYRAKAFIDTVGKRTGDVLGAQTFAALGSLGWLGATISIAMLPVAAGLIALCLLLGSAQQQAVASLPRKPSSNAEKARETN